MIKKDIRNRPDVFFCRWGIFLFVDLGPRVLERHRAVEHQMTGGRVGVGAEVAHALELYGPAYGDVAQRRFEVACDFDH